MAVGVQREEEEEARFRAAAAAEGCCRTRTAEEGVLRTTRREEGEALHRKLLEGGHKRSYSPYREPHQEPHQGRQIPKAWGPTEEGEEFQKVEPKERPSLKVQSGVPGKVVARAQGWILRMGRSVLWEGHRGDG